MTSLTRPLCILIKGTHFLRGNTHRTRRESTNEVNFQHTILLSFLCNCFLFSHEGSSIITFTYLVFSTRQSAFAVYSASSQRSSQNCEIVKNSGSYLRPTHVKRPIAVPNHIIWKERKDKSSCDARKTPKVLESLFCSNYDLFCNLFLAWVNTSCLWYHTDIAKSWLLAGVTASITIHYKTLEKQKQKTKNCKNIIPSCGMR